MLVNNLLIFFVPLISANFNFNLKSHLDTAIKSLYTRNNSTNSTQPTEFPLTNRKCFQCAVNKLDRKLCRKNNPHLKPYKCKRFGCCYNAEDKMCYRPSKKQCPLSRCESVNVKKRSLITEILNSDRSTCPYCYDGKREQCYLPDKPVCPRVLKENVEYKRCGWKRIKRNYCELESGCCWNKQKRFCHYGVVQEEEKEGEEEETDEVELKTEPVEILK